LLPALLCGALSLLLLAAFVGGPSDRSLIPDSHAVVSDLRRIQDLGLLRAEPTHHKMIAAIADRLVIEMLGPQLQPLPLPCAMPFPSPV
jgi:hypothetical protein